MRSRLGLLLPAFLLAGCQAESRSERLVHDIVVARAQFRAVAQPPFGLEPGPFEPGWERRGVDLLALLERAPGGFDGNYLVIRLWGERTSLNAYGEAPTLAVPADWRVLARIEDERPGPGLREYYLRFVGRRLAAVSAHRVDRVGRATCINNDGGAILYVTDGAPLTAAEEGERERFVPTPADGRGFRLCTAVRAAPEGRLAFRWYDGEGRTLPTMNAFLGRYQGIIEPRRPLLSYRSPAH